MTPKEIKERFDRLEADLRRLQMGWRPSEIDLRDAVKIESWQEEGVENGHTVLVGYPLNHPTIRGFHGMATSYVYFIDRELGIARTQSRWYRLGTEMTAEVKARREEIRQQVEAERQAKKTTHHFVDMPKDTWLTDHFELPEDDDGIPKVRM